MAGSSSEGRTSRTRSVGTKITEEEYARLEASAAESGLTVGEWCREVLRPSEGAADTDGIILRLANPMQSSPTLIESLAPLILRSGVPLKAVAAIGASSNWTHVS